MNQFLKVEGVVAAQTPLIEPIFQSILKDFSTVIEIGFHRGAFSLWLHKNKLKDTKLVSYDISFDSKDVYNDSIDFRKGDCFAADIVEDIKNLIKLPGKTLVLCDGGNKEQEFKLYSTFLKSEDVIMLHDYAHNQEEYSFITSTLGWTTGAESRYENIMKAVESNNLEPFNYNMFKSVLWGAFRKK